MPPLGDLLQQGTLNIPAFALSAILLGALHGLEPGHSKTMMAAFIVAIRGTVKQAVLLGLAATFSHTMVVWVVALGGMYFWHNLNAETAEPYLQLVSGIIIILMAAWMMWRARKDNIKATRQFSSFTTAKGQGYGVVTKNLPHNHSGLQGLDVSSPEYQDAHERAHANDIRRRFAEQKVTNWQILMFGLTGGLIPCPAAITVLLICLQLKEITLGAGLVLCFSIGLALTLVVVGAVAAIGVRHTSKRFPSLGKIARKAPYLSGLLIMLVGLYVCYHGVSQFNWH
jgi:nickel/cobalt exporter